MTWRRHSRLPYRRLSSLLASGIRQIALSVWASAD
jgi:hypothetical protein